jgi:hypothetical protein
MVGDEEDQEEEAEENKPTEEKWRSDIGGS